MMPRSCDADRRLLRATTLAAVLAMAIGAAWTTIAKGPPQSTLQGSHLHKLLKAKPASAKALLYPKRGKSLKFDHRAHASNACGMCHSAARASARSRDVLLPTMDSCVGCHAQQAKPKLTQCAGCHSGYRGKDAAGNASTPTQWRAHRPAPMVAPTPEARLRFDHKRHLRMVLALLPKAQRGDDKALCQSCHRPDSAGRPTMPSKASCSGCHDGKTAPSSCTSCHPTSPAGRMQTSFVDPQGGGTQRLKPSNHGVAWDKRHRPIAKSQTDDCANCHSEVDCARCHNETVAAPFAVHPPNFVAIHSVAARHDAGRCTDCHQVTNFCASCHARTRNVPTEPQRPPPKKQFHPPGFVDATNPRNHGVLARRNIADCASCHSERDCVSCHANINPHPARFTLNCKGWLQANPKPCAACHSDLNALRRLCR